MDPYRPLFLFAGLLLAGSLCFWAGRRWERRRHRAAWALAQYWLGSNGDIIAAMHAANCRLAEENEQLERAARRWERVGSN